MVAKVNGVSVFLDNLDGLVWDEESNSYYTKLCFEKHNLEKKKIEDFYKEMREANKNKNEDEDICECVCKKCGRSME